MLIKKLDGKKAALLAEATVSLLKPYRGRVFTITADNGKEFARHDLIATMKIIWNVHPISPSS